MKKRYVVLGILILGLSVWYWFSLPKSYTYEPTDLHDDFDTFYQQQLRESAAMKARSGNEEKLIRYAEQTGKVILYIHGYTASRAEGEHTIDRIAEQYQANTYYLRLPGHGTNKEDHASRGFDEYLDEAIETLHMVQQLGDTVIVVGTSMGGLVATYLAAEYPDKVDALILSSPFYDYASGLGSLLKIPGILRVMEWKDGPIRPMVRNEAWEKIKAEGYENYWQHEQYYKALQSLEDLRNFASREKFRNKIDQPVLMLAYYKDEENQDRAASVAAMEAGYNEFASTQRNDPRNKLVKLPESNHVMMSRYIKTDKAPVEAEIKAFIDRL